MHRQMTTPVQVTTGNMTGENIAWSTVLPSEQLTLSFHLAICIQKSVHKTIY